VPQIYYCGPGFGRDRHWLEPPIELRGIGVGATTDHLDEHSHGHVIVSDARPNPALHTVDGGELIGGLHRDLYHHHGASAIVIV
jgi:hypothetical protein